MPDRKWKPCTVVLLLLLVGHLIMIRVNEFARILGADEFESEEQEKMSVSYAKLWLGFVLVYLFLEGRGRRRDTWVG